ncbi:hypothetical protein SDRG_16103 [Saprolegnia diclina VS20]|uniref:Uncharacterized protein n=1 Tax=Saprolegnia diclina (strain VS20) TaxID=1156394 RepID=T0R971_SAPDV|nr:hypothetical protein SDRG_16103 [Saprolegnia diclina VS20]EQC26037.1 hypothetical protein SDRG_16103 [Saprolegnia diclina VS20]|eukprot:XP_008620522.1 hypothetical protein SDRG_16103 [Saprolegnia diclina VS20]
MVVGRPRHFLLGLAASLPYVLAEKTSNSSLPVGTNPAPYSAQRSLATGCFFGSFTCPNGATACIDPIEFAGCAFDTVTPLSIDGIAPDFFGLMKDFTDGTSNFIVDFADQMLNDAIQDLIECGNFLSGNRPTCSTLASLRSFQGQVGAKGLTATDVRRIENGLAKAKDVASGVTQECKTGCTQGECSGDALTYTEPTGCTCQSLMLNTSDPQLFTVTAPECAINAGLFLANAKGALELTMKIQFSYMGCFVGTKDAPSEWRRCTNAYAYDDLPGAMFVRCVDQSNREGDLTRTTQGNPSSSSSSSSKAGWMSLLPVAMIGGYLYLRNQKKNAQPPTTTPDPAKPSVSAAPQVKAAVEISLDTEIVCEID